MANPIDTSTATTAEGQFLMLVSAMNNLENGNTDSDGVALTDNIQINPNNETNTIAVAVSLPVNAAASTNGVTYTANNFLVDS